MDPCISSFKVLPWWFQQETWLRTSALEHRFSCSSTLNCCAGSFQTVTPNLPLVNSKHSIPFAPSFVFRTRTWEFSAHPRGANGSSFNHPRLVPLFLKLLPRPLSWPFLSASSQLYILSGICRSEKNRSIHVSSLREQDGFIFWPVFLKLGSADISGIHQFCRTIFCFHFQLGNKWHMLSSHPFISHLQDLSARVCVL